MHATSCESTINTVRCISEYAAWISILHRFIQHSTLNPQTSEVVLNFISREMIRFTAIFVFSSLNSDEWHAMLALRSFFKFSPKKKRQPQNVFSVQTTDSKKMSMVIIIIIAVHYICARCHNYYIDLMKQITCSCGRLSFVTFFFFYFFFMRLDAFSCYLISIANANWLIFRVWRGFFFHLSAEWIGWVVWGMNIQYILSKMDLIGSRPARLQIKKSSFRKIYGIFLRRVRTTSL